MDGDVYDGVTDIAASETSHRTDGLLVCCM